MKSDGTRRGNGAWLLWLGSSWLVGAVFLVALTFVDIFMGWWETDHILMWSPTLSALSPDPFTRKEWLAIVALVVGGGIPVIGLVISLVRRRMAVAAVFAASLAVLTIAVIRMTPGPFALRYIDYAIVAPSICEASPDSSAEVPWFCD
ncbi:hypothetical protein [Planomonospora parontospora]|uniref:hypothetical protein n=1 Tax=Planomonospora parontospora TaxID=58119 RepID=UPI001671009B|nr:hypothetical protein [Planomonospora parontospora]GGL23657.1 hypothetical protein GCM10014719_26730 [Planomonospora parontospora subsp. antibiotica]GII15036.1 hypothetical protein Ppa05_17620 [Planomonospora parontospora subsp. antibiotica]